MERALSKLLQGAAAPDADLRQETASLLAWLLARLQPSNQERAFVGLGLIWLAISTPLSIEETALEALSDWIVDEERQKLPDLAPGSGYLFRPGMSTLWKTLGNQLKSREMTSLSASLQSKEKDIAELLA